MRTRLKQFTSGALAASLSVALGLLPAASLHGLENPTPTPMPAPAPLPAPTDPASTKDPLAAGEKPPASLIQAIAAKISIKRFCSDPFDQSQQEDILTPQGNVLKCDETELVLSKDGKERRLPWQGMPPADFYDLAERLLAKDDLSSRDGLLVYAINHKMARQARAQFDAMTKACAAMQAKLQADQQKTIESGGWNQGTADALQQQWMILNRVNQILQRRSAGVKQVEALAANGGAVVNSAQPRTVDDIDTAFTESEVITIGVSFDTGVQAGKNKDVNLGKAAILEVKDYEDTEEWGWVLQRVYMRFSLRQLRGRKITGVWLAAYGNLGDGDKPVTVDLRPLAKDQTAWNEYKLTWNNQPDVKSDPVGKLIFTYGKTETRATEGRWYISGDMKPWLEKEIADNRAEVGFQLSTTIKEEACLFAREHANGRKTSARLIVAVEPQAGDDAILENLDN